MRYLVRTSVGLALLAAGLTAVEYALFHLIQAGSCITRGDFLADQGACISDTGSWAELLPFGGVAALIGIGVFAARGAPSDESAPARQLSAGVVAWSAALAPSGGTAIYAVTAPSSGVQASARTVGIAGGCALIGIGALPLLRELILLGRARTTDEAVGLPSSSYDQPWTPTPAPTPTWTPAPPPAPPPAQTPPPQPPPQPAGTSAVERLNALARQRDAGEIDDEEFERLKAEVLSDMTRGL